jgi:hypothetical protein
LILLWLVVFAFDGLEQAAGQVREFLKKLGMACVLHCNIGAPLLRACHRV